MSSIYLTLSVGNGNVYLAIKIYYIFNLLLCKCQVHLFPNKGKPIWLCLHHFIDQNQSSFLQVAVILPLWIFR